MELLPILQQSIARCLHRNDLKPMQNVTAKGPGGPNDYSRWTYTYNERYHNITAGINELTSKITCYDDTTNMTKKYYRVNVTGS
jgi:hypothetical protein